MPAKVLPPGRSRRLPPVPAAAPGRPRRRRAADVIVPFGAHRPRSRHEGAEERVIADRKLAKSSAQIDELLGSRWEKILGRVDARAVQR